MDLETVCDLPSTCAMSRSWGICVFYCAWLAQRAAAMEMESHNRVAYLHIPKTGGTSVDWSLGFTPSIAKSMCRVGHWPGSGDEICDCRQAECLQPAQVAVMEYPHVHMASLTRVVKNATWLWLAAIREPESWFYSAAGQMCTGPKFFSNPVCLTNGTTSPYDAEWFKTTPSFPVYYPFTAANRQSMMLGDIFLEDNWMVCTLPHLNTLVEVLRMRLGNFKLGHYQEVHTYG